MSATAVGQSSGYATLNGGTTGGAGGQTVYATTGTEIHAALCNRASSDTPIIIQVEGTINHTNTSKVSGESCNTAEDKIEIKDVSNVSIIGVGNGALFDELGIHLRNTSNVILQNLHVRNVKKSGSPTSNGGDAIGMESDVYNVWVDHVTLEASGGESEGYDGLFDMKATTKYVTLSYSILRNSGRGGLVGSSDSDNNNGPVTYHHNLFENLDSRVPLLRHATAHAYNNYYRGITKSGMNPRIGGQIKADNNYFEDSKDPLGTFYTNDMGYWEVSGNIWSNITWSADGDDNHPAGPNPVSTTSISIPYAYTLDDAGCVPQIVLAAAGANTGLLESDGNCQSTSGDGTGGDPGSGSDTGDGSDSGDSGGETGGEFELGANLALDAGADGSSKGSGSSYGNVTDGDLTSVWEPSSTSDERISVKWGSATAFNTVIIREDGSAVQNWRLVDHDTGEELASGTGIGSERMVSLGDVSMSKVNLLIDSASGAPRIAEFEVYDATGSPDGGSGDGGSSEPGSVALSATAMGTDVDLTWTVSNIDIQNQEVYRDSDPDPVGRVRIATGVSGSVYTDSGLTGGTYYYWVKVTDTGGVVTDSNNASALVSTSGNSILTLEENETGFCAVEGAIESEHGGFNGAGYANTENATGAGIDWSVTVPSAGIYTLQWRFANGGADRPAALLVSGVESASVNMPGTGGWTSYADSTSVVVSLASGYNALRLEATGADGLANIDSLSISGASPVAGDCNGGTTGGSSGGDSGDGSGGSGGGTGELVLGNNLAAGVGADGSSKGNGSSYGNVTDGDLTSVWEPSSSDGERISVKWSGNTAFNTVILREDGSAAQDWRLINHDTGAQLASGSGIGAELVVTVGDVSMSKINLLVDSASAAPRIAEFEVYNATGNPDASDGGTGSGDASGGDTAGGGSSGGNTSGGDASGGDTSGGDSSGGTSGGNNGSVSNACYNLATDPNVNWRDSAELTTDQEIVACLSQTLGRAVGYGENALGGYDPGGNSKLTVITTNSPLSVEQQILDAITGDEYNWIVFDKFDFAVETEISMHRLHCGDTSVQAAIGGTAAQCVDYRQWCAVNGYGSGEGCLQEFFNNRLNDKDLPIRNPVIGSNTTIDGRHANAYFRFSGFAIGKDSSGQPIQTANSVILTHLQFRGAGHTEDHGLDPDMIRSTGASSDIWIHKNTFDTTGDSAFDVKIGAYDITMSFNRLVNVKRASLHGSSDSRTINEQITTTMHHNAFVTTDDDFFNLGNTLRRVPLIRRGTSHMFNNLFMNYRKDILSVRVGASVLWEDNMFLINGDFQEKSDINAAIDERVTQLARDVDGGNFRDEGGRLWFADSACNLNPSLFRDIDDASGSVGDLSLNYSQTSQDVINAQRTDAGQDMADYISATAGKYGEMPFNSPLASSQSYVLDLGKVPCQ